MKILLDESLDVKLKDHLPEFETYTVRDMNWQGIKNGQLLSLAANNNFDIFLTADRNIVHQQNLDKFSLIIIAFKSVSNDIKFHISLISDLKTILNRIHEKGLKGKYFEV